MNKIKSIFYYIIFVFIIVFLLIMNNQNFAFARTYGDNNDQSPLNYRGAEILFQIRQRRATLEAMIDEIAAEDAAAALRAQSSDAIYRNQQARIAALSERNAQLESENAQLRGSMSSNGNIHHR